MTKTLIPMTALVIGLGVFYSYRMLKTSTMGTTKADASKQGVARDLLRASWPILLVVTLVLLGLNAVLAFPLALILLAAQQRAAWPELKMSLRYGLDVKILFLLYALMLYKATIESSGAAYALFTDMQNIGLPTLAIVAALPFLMGFATGISMGFVGISLPLLIPFLTLGSEVNVYGMLLAYISGYVGVLLSPLHLCLILSTEYFQASLAKVYRYILPPLLTIEGVAMLVYYLAA